MLLFYAFILVITLYKIRFRKLYSGYGHFDIKYTHSINGIFIMLVFVRHIFQYIKVEMSHLSLTDSIAAAIDNSMLQLLVVPFLFFSGYGVAISIKNRGGKKLE